MIRVGSKPLRKPVDGVELHWRLWLNNPESSMPPGSFKEAVARGFGPRHVRALGGGDMREGVRKTSTIFNISPLRVFITNLNAAGEFTPLVL